MTVEKIFVGRKAELEQFKKVLEEPRGQAVLVVGNRGMGKTWLVNKMAELAENHPDLECGCVRYEVVQTDSVDTTMEQMMDNAFEAAQVEEGPFVGTNRRLEQWRSLLNVFNIGDLVMSLRRDHAKNTREQFLERLQLVSEGLPDNGRVIFIIDPEKYVQEKSAPAWRIVVKQLPAKIKFIFAQRTEDELVKSKVFMALENVEPIPKDYLGRLAENEVQELVRLRTSSVGRAGRVLRDAVGRYEGHPYAIQAALDIVKKAKSVRALPQDPTPEAIAESQWEQVCNAGADAISLFEAYAVLEVGVPDDVVQSVSGLKTNTRKQLHKDSYLRGLLREEGYGKRIYHAILTDCILKQIGEKGMVTEDISRAIIDLLESRDSELLGLFDTILGVLEERIRKEGHHNLLNDYVSLASAFAESQEEGSIQRTYRYQSIGRILKDLGRKEFKEYYIRTACEYENQGAMRAEKRFEKFWCSESFFQAGWCCEHSGDWGKAATCYSRAQNELKGSSVAWNNLLQAELLRCQGVCVRNELQETRECNKSEILRNSGERVLLDAEERFKEEFREGWTHIGILDELGRICSTVAERKKLESAAEKLRQSMVSHKPDRVRCRALFLRNVHDEYLMDKIRQVFLDHEVSVEMIDARSFVKNQDEFTHSGNWSYIVTLGGPVSKDGLFDWRYDVFGQHKDFRRLLERSVGFFGLWLSEYVQCKAILLAGVGKYRTFLGIRDVIEEECLAEVLREDVKSGLLWDRKYEPSRGIG